MKFPEKYIKRGEFTLHSGETSDILYDVNAMLTDPIWTIRIRKATPSYSAYVGIATGGALIVNIAPWVMFKDGELKGNIKMLKETDYCLVDDVCTTEASLREAMKVLYDKVGKYPEEIFVVVDRRKGLRNLHIESMFQNYTEVNKK